ncbi:Sec-independent protein translocase protein TatB [Mangrovicoccus algicola]|uniref:Sec-independent protein translocase protein TatB n=1 Tax=Mangrovicoccus algicola TaxID=2771008 RepID=A0A8J7CZ88_9RHOB|nr:Sec-independent protein translocase protein TatB [Mangrovicoccus algicola]MBE3640557.1 twin-arginine translocase subunit TatB [Mangrovicoccus algicola]
MFDIGWSELLVVGVVALIVVGPKDLPVMFRTVGRFTGKARAMAREFTSAMNAAADEAGVNDLQKDLRDIANPRATGMRKVQEAADAFEKWDPMGARDGKTKAAPAAAPDADAPAADPGAQTGDDPGAPAAAAGSQPDRTA